MTLFSAGRWTFEWWHCVPQCTAAGASSLSGGVAFTSYRTIRVSQPLRNYTPQHVFLSQTFSSATIMFASLLLFLHVILSCHWSGHRWQTDWAAVQLDPDRYTSLVSTKYWSTGLNRGLWYLSHLLSCCGSNLNVQKQPYKYWIVFGWWCFHSSGGNSLFYSVFGSF